MENQDGNQVLNQNDDQNTKKCIVIIEKNYKKKLNQGQGTDVNVEQEIDTNASATLVFTIPDDEHYKFLQEENIQKKVVLVQYCKYQNGHEYTVDDEISAGSTLEKWKNQKLVLSLEDNFPFEKLQYYKDKKFVFEWEDKPLNIKISLKLIATDLTSDFSYRKQIEFILKQISFDEEAEKYIKQQSFDFNKEKVNFKKNLNSPTYYPNKYSDNLVINFSIDQIIQPNQSIILENFRIQSSLNIQNIFVYSGYQVTIKSKQFALPLRIFEKKQLLNWRNVIDKVELSIPDLKQVPFIYESDKFRCQHFLIINLQLKKIFQVRGGIDILIPIVIINPQKKYFLSKNKIDEYFKIIISNRMVTFTLNQNIPTNQENQESQDNIVAHYEQLLV